MSYPTVTGAPTVTLEQMIEVDRVMVDDLGISLVQMMENAGRGLAKVARDVILGGDARGKRVIVLAGSGGNGGGALTAGRRLASWGAAVSVGLTRAPGDLRGVPRLQWDILSKVAQPERLDPENLHAADIILDGLIGYSLNGAPKGRAKDFIEAANTEPTPVLSLDVPSGFSVALGAAQSPTIRADVTVTLAMPKSGMEDAPTGRLFCTDISVPPSVYDTFGLTGASEVFATNDLVEIVS